MRSRSVTTMLTAYARASHGHAGAARKQHQRGDASRDVDGTGERAELRVLVTEPAGHHPFVGGDSQLLRRVAECGLHGGPEHQQDGRRDTED